MFLSMAALLALTILPVLRLQEPPPLPRVVTPGVRQLAVAWFHRAMTPGMLVLAGLIFCYRLGDQMVSSLITPFLIDQGWTSPRLPS